MNVLIGEPPGKVVLLLVYNLKLVISPITKFPLAAKDILFSTALAVVTLALKFHTIMLVEDLPTLPAPTCAKFV